MRFGMNTLDDFHVQNKTVLCRVDMNQPIDRTSGVLKSVARIQACAETIRELADNGAKVVLLAHQGSDIEYKNYFTTAPHAKALSEFMGREIHFVDDVTGPAARAAIRSLQSGEILLLDNVRFCAEEQTLFEMKLHLTHEQQAKTEVVHKLAPLADLYVCDAFAAAHRDQPSLCGFEQVLPSAMGRLFEREVSAIGKLMETPKHPCTFVLGGAKISDAFLMMETVLRNHTADTILTGGLVGNILLASQGIEIGKGTIDFIFQSNYGDLIQKAGALYRRYADCIHLPTDLARVRNGYREEAVICSIPEEFSAVDIGSATVQAYREVILNSKTIFFNGPMGIFEQAGSETGTKAILTAMADANAYTVIGGGDSITAVNQYNLGSRISYICTGGGALIRFLSGEELPVVKALRHAATVHAFRAEPIAK